MSCINLVERLREVASELQHKDSLGKFRFGPEVRSIGDKILKIAKEHEEEIME